MFLLFIPFFLFAGIIENNITNYYKQIYPTLNINNVSLRYYKQIPKHIKSIDLSHINPKKNNGTIAINNNTFVYFKLNATITIIKSSTIIKKNDIIDSFNTIKKNILFKRFYSYPLINLTPNIASKMYIPQNHIIYDYMITTPNLVKRNTPINIISKSGGIEISFSATALQNGKSGNIIKVKDKNNKIYEVKIDKDGNGILWKF